MLELREILFKVGNIYCKIPQHFADDSAKLKHKTKPKTNPKPQKNPKTTKAKKTPHTYKTNQTNRYKTTKKQSDASPFPICKPNIFIFKFTGALPGA